MRLTPAPLASNRTHSELRSGEGGLCLPGLAVQLGKPEMHKAGNCIVTAVWLDHVFQSQLHRWSLPTAPGISSPARPELTPAWR